MSIARIAFRFTMERSSERGNQTAVVTTYRVEGSLVVISPSPEGPRPKAPNVRLHSYRLENSGYQSLASE